MDEAEGPEAQGGYRTGNKLWRAAEAGFGGWELRGLALAREGIVLDPAGIGGSGEATSPVLETGFPFLEAVPSWNARAGEGSWLEVFLRARTKRGWTSWYAMGSWAEGAGNPRRRSLGLQEDADGAVHTDTLRLKTPGTALQLKVALRSDGRDSIHNLRNTGIAYSGPRPASPAAGGRKGESRHWGRPPLEVPAWSQMIYPEGGRTWCSPTSLAMLMAYWEPTSQDRDSRIGEAVAGVFDPAYEGCGNWSFNAAYAGSRGLDAFVLRFSSLADLEPLIGAGIPLALSLSWDNSGLRRLSSAPVSSSSGHLIVLVGFDADGNPVMNEPAAPWGASVRRTYGRSELEARWLEASGGTVYLVAPGGKGIAGLL
jgi:hypothetical protein